MLTYFGTQFHERYDSRLIQAPILQKYNFSGTFFIYPGVTDHKGFLTETEIATLYQSGHEIGAHTMIHHHLPKLADPEKISFELMTYPFLILSPICQYGGIKRRIK